MKGPDGQRVQGLSPEEIRAVREDVMTSASIGLYRYRFDGAVIFMDRTALRILDLEDRFPGPSMVLGQNVRDLIDHCMPEGILRKTVRERGQVNHFEYRFRTLKGQEKWTLHDAYIVQNQATGEESVQVAVRDVTAFKQAEAAYRESEAKYRLLAEHSADVIWTCDAGGRLEYVSPSVRRLLGYTPDEAVALGVQGLVTASCYHAIEQTQALFARAGPDAMDGARLEVEAVRKDGHPVWVEVVTSPLLDEAGRFTGAVGNARDITEHKEAERALRESKERYQSLFEGVPVGLFRTTPEGDILDANTTMAKMLGFDDREDLVNKNMASFHGGEEERAVRVAGVERARHVVSFEGEMYRWDGRPVWVKGSASAYRDADGSVLYYEGAMEDHTESRRTEKERQRLQEQVQWAQKIESLGVMAGGVAHHFNNLLMVILGNAELLREDCAGRQDCSSRIDEIESAASKAADLCRQIQAYASKGPLAGDPIDLNRVALEAGNHLKRNLPRAVTLRVETEEGLPAVRGRSGELHRIVLNLLANAEEALGGRKGSIELRTSSRRWTMAELTATHLGTGLSPGRYVSVTVSDTGDGMDGDVVNRIFDPFFTTKFTGRGLGLAMVYGLVRQHDGAIDVQSEEGVGTTVEVLFPAIAVPGRKEESEEADWRGSGTVLLVDDELPVLHLGQRTLARRGFTVLTARDGQEAVDIFRKRAREIDVVILDLAMPRKSGYEALAEMRAHRPNVRVIVASGYSAGQIDTLLTNDGVAAVLPKPYSLARLTKTLREVLGE